MRAHWSWCAQLLALCLNRGPLTMQLTPVQFFAVLLLPIIPHDGKYVRWEHTSLKNPAF